MSWGTEEPLFVQGSCLCCIGLSHYYPITKGGGGISKALLFYFMSSIMYVELEGEVWEEGAAGWWPVEGEEENGGCLGWLVAGTVNESGGPARTRAGTSGALFSPLRFREACSSR